MSSWVFFSEPTFEPWDWHNPDTVGIGGSETSHIEMSRRLAERRHAVDSFAPVPFASATVGPGGVLWRHSRDVKFWYNSVNVIYRHPAALDLAPQGAPAWLICQDVEYGDRLTEERAGKLTRLVALCEEHGRFLRQRYPFAAGKVCVSSNGIKVGYQFAERNPKRMIYASSPDRGLISLLAVFARVKEIVPAAELHVYYGWDNIDKVICSGTYAGQRAASIKTKLCRMVEESGAVWHGRTPQPRLAEEWMKAGIWCHPSGFTETSCITCMEAQAFGAIPVTNPYWAVGENVRHGVFIEGNPEDSMVRARYVLEVVRLMLDESRQEEIRAEMTPWAREKFNWERVVDQWEEWAGEDLAAVARTMAPVAEFAEAQRSDA